MFNSPRPRLFLASCVLLSLAAHSGRAEDVFWTNPAGGNWTVAANWSANRVPGGEDQVFITLAGTYTVTLNAAAVIAALTVGGGSGAQTFTTGSQNLTIGGPAMVGSNGVFALSGGSLNSAYDLTVQGALAWTGGLMSGAGRTIIAGGATAALGGAGTKGLDAGRVLENRGTVLWTGGTIDLNDLAVGGSGRVENTAAGLLDIQLAGGTLRASGYPDVGTAPLPGLANAGTLRRSAGGDDVSLAVPFTNTGTVEVLAGILNATSLVTITPESRFRFVLGGPSLGGGHVQFRVGGSLTLRGTVEFALANGFMPADGQEFTIISAGSLVGTFSDALGNVLPNAVFLNPIYTSREVIVRTQDGRPILQTRIGSPGSQFRLNGVAGQTYRIHAAADLGVQDWTLLATIRLSGSGRLDFVDPEAAGFPQRFYLVEFVPHEP